MESDDEKIEIIKLKVRNTLNLKNVNPDVKGWIEKRSTQQPPFRGHYYTPYELTADIKLVEDSSKRNTLIVWLRGQKTRGPIIRQALDYFEKEQ